MTDAVSKNLGIENTIPASLGSEHHPIHLLCKSHTVEALDRSNLDVSSSIEKKVDQQTRVRKNKSCTEVLFSRKNCIGRNQSYANPDNT